MRIQMNKIVFEFLTFIALITYSPLSAQIKTEVVILSSGSDIINKEIGGALSAVLQEANKVATGAGSIENVREYFTVDGFEAFEDLIAKTGFFSTISEYRVRILETSTGKFEVRGIKVRVNMGDTTGDDIQELVFVLNFRFFIDDLHFAMEQHHYQRLIDEGQELKDLHKRQQILDFLEEFRTAHNRKDIGYLEKAYSDDALIIVGKVLKAQEGFGDYLESSTLGENKIKFIRLSKQEYIERLRQVFKLNAFVRVTFEQVEINLHSKYPDIYGIQVKQKWNSSTYSDEGYLFVMMDFQNPEKPIIHVRAWQPEKFSDGSIVSLGDFKIIDY